MSRFFDAMEQTVERVRRPAPVDLEDAEALDLAAEGLSKTRREEGLEWDESDSGPPRIAGPKQADVAARIGILAPPCSDEEAAERALLEDPIHPAYERIIQKLITFRRSPRQGGILVAGAVRGQGASTIARNTALAIGRAQTDRVVLVDSDIRAPSQHIHFSTEVSNGLSDVLRGPVSLASAVRTSVAPGVSLLTAGSPVGSPPQLLNVASIQGVVIALLSLYDWVILDGPPLTAFPEAASLAAASGGSVLVVRAETTRSEVAEDAKRVLEESGTEVLGAVLNRRKHHIPEFIYRRLWGG